MIAGGTGVSPFRSYIVHHAADPACGEMWLVLGARDAGEACYLDEFERLAQSVPLHIRVALSREHGRRLDDVLLGDDVAAAVWRLLRDPAEGVRAALCTSAAPLASRPPSPALSAQSSAAMSPPRRPSCDSGDSSGVAATSRRSSRPTTLRLPLNA
jgi:hypothetical protein